jgi:hypothetical protein
MHIWPPPRHNAIICVLGHIISFSLQEHPTLDLQDYIESFGVPGGRCIGGVREPRFMGNILTYLSNDFKSRGLEGRGVQCPGVSKAVRWKYEVTGGGSWLGGRITLRSKRVGVIVIGIEMLQIYVLNELNEH